MPKRKSKIFEAENRDTKKHSKVSSASEINLEETKTICWIFLLPSEILQQIFNLLPPRSLNAVAELNCELFKDSLQRINSIDLSLCNDISHRELQQLFVTDRTPFIRRINFNHLFVATVSDIESQILKCKNLTYLSVVGCGLTLKNICRILNMCKKLKELHWNVDMSDRYTNCDENSPLHLKKLYLYFEKLEYMEFFLFIRCPWISAREVYLIVSQNLSSFVSCSCRSSFLFRLHFNKNSSMDSSLKEWIDMYRCLRVKRFNIFDWILVLDHEEDMTDSNTLKAVRFSFTMEAPYLQLQTGDFSRSSSIPEDSVKKLVLHSFGKTLLPQEENILLKVISKKLKYLSIQENACISENLSNLNLYNGEIDINQQVQVIPSWGSLSDFISNCCNIQDLLISDLHFNGSFDFEPLFCLSGLKSLALPSCVFYSESAGPPEIKYLSLNQDAIFHELVEKCNEVHHFSMYGCHLCDHGPKDKDISAVPFWKKLQTLTLEKIKTLCFCHFLRYLPENCPDFKNLELINIGYPLRRNYLPNVMHVLSNSPQLAVLRTVLDSPHVKNKNFWFAISNAKNLQILCLVSPYNVICKPICDAVNKLPSLHLFHLCLPNRNNGLITNIRRSMKRNGIKQPKVEVMITQTDSHGFDSCIKSHFYVP